MGAATRGIGPAAVLAWTLGLTACVLTFDQAGAGTRVTFRGDPNPAGPFKLLSPLFTYKGQQVWSERLARAKATLEASPS